MEKGNFSGYSKEVMKRFFDLKNSGEILNPDGYGVHGNIKCGDEMHIYLKVQKNKIKDIKFKTWGCVAAIASSDALCDLARGKTIEEAKMITNQEIMGRLKGLPIPKIHCSILGAQALKKAILDYEKKQGKNINSELKELENEEESCSLSH